MEERHARVVDDVCVAWGRPTAGGTRGACPGSPDQEFAELLAGVGVPPLPVGQPVRLPGIKATPPSATDLPPRAAELVAVQCDTVAAAAEECDALFATGVMPTGGWR